MIMKNKRLFQVLALSAVLALSSCGASNETADAAIGGGADFAPTDGAYKEAADEYYAADGDFAAGDSFDAEGEFAYEEGVYIEESVVADSMTSDESSEEYTYEEKREYSQSQARAGLLTGGEWNDNKNFSFWTDLLTKRDDWSYMPERWNLNTLNRIAVTVTDGDKPAENVTVKLVSGKSVLWKAVSDNNGNAYLFKTLSNSGQYVPTKIVAEQGGKTLTEVEYSQGEEITLNVSSQTYGGDVLDLMFMVDTTGSMGDELSYLQVELYDIVEQVSSNNQIPVRLSVNFYRDEGDDYVVRTNDFTTDIDAAIHELSQEYAAGGGDYEEAVEQALYEAVNYNTWQEGNTKLMFLILDAPPHYSSDNAEKLSSVLAQAAAQGIRIIPVASSGVDTETEFLCRTFAVATGGTYTFLTDHSGVGGSHLEPTVGYYQVEKLNDMIVRIIDSYL